MFFVRKIDWVEKIHNLQGRFKLAFSSLENMKRPEQIS